MIGCWFVPISLFIFGWTSPPYVTPGGGNWVGPVSSGIPFGFGSEYFSCLLSRIRCSSPLCSGHHLFLGECVPHRRFPGLRRLRSRCEDRHPVRIRCCDAAVHYCDVPQSRQRLGSVDLGLHLPRYGTYIKTCLFDPLTDWRVSRRFLFPSSSTSTENPSVRGLSVPPCNSLDIPSFPYSLSRFPTLSRTPSPF